jgi:hypothetical protein
MYDNMSVQYLLQEYVVVSILIYVVVDDDDVDDTAY